jgi:hypothetical protein
MSPAAVPASWLNADAPVPPAWPARQPTLPTRRLFTYEAEEHVLSLNIDNTSLSHFEVCPRSAEYRLVHSREGTANTAAKVYGSAKHLYLEKRLKGGSIPEAEQIMVDYLTVHQVDDPQNWRTATHAIESMRGYENFWNAMQITPVVREGKPLVEVPFRLPLCEITIAFENPPLTRERLIPLLTNLEEFADSPVPGLIRVFWTGKIDVVAPFLGDAYVWDHKSTSIVGPTYYDDFQLSAQTHGYCWAANHLWPDLDIKGLRINTIVGRAPSRTGVAHAYERQSYVYSDESLMEWHRDCQTLVADFVSHLLRGYFPKATRWCQGRWGQCQYFPVCTTVPQSRDIVLASNLYSDVVWSPLHPSEI